MFEKRVEAAAKAMHVLTEGDPFEEYHPSHKQELQDMARAALRAADAVVTVDQIEKIMRWNDHLDWPERAEALHTALFCGGGRE